MKKENKTTKTTIKVSDAVRAYNALKDLGIVKLKKEDMFAVLRAANAIKPVAKAFEDFVKDVQERLRPEGFSEITEKAQKFDSLTPEEQAEVNNVIGEYQKSVNECVIEEQEKEKEVDAYRRLNEDAFGDLIQSNEKLTVDDILLLQKILCKE